MKQMKQKQTLRQFFVNGGKGTNAEIAKKLNMSLGSVRSGISDLRHDYGLPILKGHETINSRYVVYAMDSGYRDGAHTIKGRPVLLKNRHRVF